MQVNTNSLQLPSGATLPSVGYGLWKVPEANAPELIVDAVKIGYRHFDSACDYGNEKGVGEGIRRTLSSGICTRQDLWITSKLWNTFHRAEHVRLAAERTLKDLGLEYLDLYLIHFPISLAYVPPETRYPPGWFHDPDAAHPKMQLSPVPIIETWRAMEALKDAGLVRHIGICNFNISLIRDLNSQARYRPEVLQVESHPYLVQPKLLRFCREEQIAFTAFSPLGAPSYVPLGMATASESVLLDPVITDMAQRYRRTPAQIVLRWGVQRGTSVIPKSSQPSRLRENIDLFDFSLAAEDVARIDALDRGQRFNDPGVFCESAFNTFCPIYE